MRSSQDQPEGFEEVRLFWLFVHWYLVFAGGLAGTIVGAILGASFARMGHPY